MADEEYEEELGEDGDEARPPRLRLSRRGVVVLVALGALLVGSLAWTVFFSSALDVRRVAVQGLDSGRLTQDEVERALGATARGPLARVDLDRARAEVAKVPRVAQVEVWRGWPHTLRVKVTERRAVAAVRADDGRFVQVDAQGVEFATEPQPPSGVPVVALQLAQPALDALPVIDRPALVRSAVTVAAGLPPDVAKQAGSLTVYSYDDIRLQLASGATVRWGSAEDTPRKSRVLTALLGRKASNYDVSAPDAPAVSG
ncbi:cell division protein FtsQ/DivIB [Streptomyces sp. TLI_171]|uniref:cell division protein FtsQ/DivIB n=1 Tax=Streptomyces sp. TLI_171 TaxID=1938859 RepID=UPI000C1A066E|nr:FtsQ-type POTRA domain-containing protein [Streptomyces sp. TLI_171]RKE18650.1 cell division protein FtsQ [Streptomyces sp. TLI_171]